MSGWKADDAHRAAAQAIEDALSTEIFDGLDHEVRHLDGPAEGGRLELEDPDTYVDANGTALYDGYVWPVPMVDKAGRRFEVEVEVTVRPLPDGQTQLARHAAAVAGLSAHRG